jgi:hypothetical protein
LFHHDRARRLSIGREACYIPAMTYIRLVTFIVLCAAQVGQAALAAPLVEAPPPDARPLIEPAARKGTRAYAPDGTETAIPAVSPEANAPAGSDALAQCMDTWDAGTHISKSKWREICVRQLKDRDQ